jgi:hypothetical protein
VRVLHTVLPVCVAVARRGWRSKLHKGQFVSLKNPVPGDAVTYCQDLLQFRWERPRDGREMVVVLPLMRWAHLTGECCNNTGFPFFELERVPVGLVPPAEVASPVHLVHVCTSEDEDPRGFCGGNDGALKHNIEDNPLFLLNRTFFK